MDSLSHTAFLLKKHYILGANKEMLFGGHLKASHLAEQLGIHKSVLSKIVWGQRKEVKYCLTPALIDNFCQILQLSKAEQQALYQAAEQDWFEKKGGNVDILVPFNCVQEANATRDHIYQIRISGLPHLAMDIAEQLYHKLDEWLSVESLFQKELTPIAMRMIYDEHDSYKESASIKQLYQFTHTTQKRFERLKNEDNRREITGLINQAWGTTYYFIGQHYALCQQSDLAKQNYERAVDCFVKSQNFVRDKHYLIRSHRTLTICYALLGDDYRKAMDGQIDSTNNIIDDCETDYRDLIVMAKEGIARALGICKDEKAFEQLKEAQKLRLKITQNRPPLPFREIQYARTLIELIMAIGTTDKSLIDTAVRLVKRQLKHAQHHQYSRHEKLLRSLLKDFKAA